MPGRITEPCQRKLKKLEAKILKKKKQNEIQEGNPEEITEAWEKT